MGGSQTILVLGATGSVGEPVARRLLADGFVVRLLTRDVDRARGRFGLDYEYQAGEVGDRAALERALDGCSGVHVSLTGGSDPATTLDQWCQRRRTAWRPLPGQPGTRTSPSRS